MSPEQLEGKEADARSDIFSFGALLYEMVTGLRAFAGDTPARVTAAILTDDPPSVSSLQSAGHRVFAQCMYYQGRDDDALAHLRKTLDLDPTLWLTHNMMGRIYGRKAMYREALREFDRATELGGSLIVRAAAGYTLAASGRRDEARAILDQLKTRAAQTYVPPSNLALVHLGLGEQEEALNRLEEAVDARDLLLTFLTVEPRWAHLAGHPRFTALLEKIGLKQ